jgi:hypothetical protein
MPRPACQAKQADLTRNEAHMCVGTTRMQTALACMLAAGPVHAAARVYFDIVGLIVVVGLYALGLLLLPLVLMAAKSRKARSWIVGVYVGLPVAWFVLALVTSSVGNALDREEIRAGREKNAQAFADYCQDRKRTVKARVITEDPITLMVRIEQGFTGTHTSFNAGIIHDHLEKNDAACDKTGVNYLEGIYHRRNLPEQKRSELGLHRFKLCSTEQPVVLGESSASRSQARYELVLGESVETKRVPWGSETGRSMSRSSARLLDTRTGATLAEDTMYFLRDDGGAEGCPAGMDQLSSLIVDVFPLR